jgi:hypothetical protein
MRFKLRLILVNVMGLGYFGGQLVCEGRIPAVSQDFLPGRKKFVSHCFGCSNSGNSFP